MRLEVNKTEAGMKAFLDLWDKRFGVMFYRKPNYPTYGMGNFAEETPDLGRFPHVPFIDYDKINEWIVEEELEWLCEKYDWAPFYLFYTRRNVDEEGSEFDRYWGNYQAISLTKEKFKVIYDALQLTHSDFNYKKAPNFTRYKFWVLRLIGKGSQVEPKFLKIVPEDCDKWYMGREISSAHLKMLEKWYDVPEIPYPFQDESEEIYTTAYLTSKVTDDKK